jgi:NADH-quinone oxidoreductase subunit C
VSARDTEAGGRAEAQDAATERREAGSVTIALDDLAEALAASFDGELTVIRLQQPVTVVADLDRKKLAGVARRLHDFAPAPFDCLNFIAAVDHVTHLECVYHLFSLPASLWLELHVTVPRTNPALDTVSTVWPGADWHEREAWDMMGVRFTGHPDLRRILLKDDWVGHPLRKDYADTITNHPYV